MDRLRWPRILNGMKHILILSLCLFLVSTAFSQKYMTREGSVRFYSSTPIEDIEAVNGQVTGLITDEGEFAFRVPILAFRFEKALMEEHFNENYLESTTYPNGSFEGRIADWNQGLKDGMWHDVTATGTLNIHGVKQPRTIPSKLKWSDDAWAIESNFQIAPADHNISIPKLVRNKIAETLDVSIQAILNPR